MAVTIIPDQDQIIVESFDVDTPAQSNRSWSGRSKAIGLPGSQTRFGSFRTRAQSTEVKRRPWRAFAASLQGIVNYFDVRVAKFQRYGDNPTVRAGTGSGKTLLLAGLPLNTYPLRAGQYVTVPLPSGHHRIAMLLADLVTDGSGNATATLDVELGEVPTTGVTVETLNPYVRARATSRRIPLNPPGGVWQIEFEEAL